MASLVSQLRPLPTAAPTETLYTEAGDMMDMGMDMGMGQYL